MGPAEENPRITGILETVLYVADIDRAERFYRDVMALKPIGKEPGRHAFFRVGSGVLLLFRAERTRRSASVPPHGAEGEIHVCFTIAANELETWKARIREHHIVIEKEAEWPGGRSFYFRDPDGNLLELANADIWPR
ncbi:MAG: VOC family protein [Candidatus Methanoperedens sp.]|nr:VOC family protein [Candidatus Methanoperedens sp.]